MYVCNIEEKICIDINTVRFKNKDLTGLDKCESNPQNHRILKCIKEYFSMCHILRFLINFGKGFSWLKNIELKEYRTVDRFREVGCLYAVPQVATGGIGVWLKSSTVSSSSISMVGMDVFILWMLIWWNFPGIIRLESIDCLTNIQQICPNASTCAPHPP